MKIRIISIIRGLLALLLIAIIVSPILFIFLDSFQTIYIQNLSNPILILVAFAIIIFLIATKKKTPEASPLKSFMYSHKNQALITFRIANILLTIALIAVFLYPFIVQLIDIVRFSDYKNILSIFLSLHVVIFFLVFGPVCVLLVAVIAFLRTQIKKLEISPELSQVVGDNPKQNTTQNPPN